MGLIKEITKDKVTVRKYNTREEMGNAAGNDIGDAIKYVLSTKNECNIIFAAAPSQNEVLETLTKVELPWDRINAFHMDEYIGLDKDAPQGFGNFLNRAIFSKLNFKNVFYLNGQTTDLDEEIHRYSNILNEYPTDIVCMGIGENGHIAFNDPHVADFNDSKVVKVVSLDEKCRMQQVNDGCFSKIQDVPKNALTLTIPTLINPTFVFCTVPGQLKAMAVKNTVYGEITTLCPASILRNKENAILYVDRDSGRDI